MNWNEPLPHTRKIFRSKRKNWRITLQPAFPKGVSYKNLEVVLSIHPPDSHLSDTSTTESRIIAEEEGRQCPYCNWKVLQKRPVLHSLVRHGGFVLLSMEHPTLIKLRINATQNSHATAPSHIMKKTSNINSYLYCPFPLKILVDCQASCSFGSGWRGNGGDEVIQP